MIIRGDTNNSQKFSIKELRVRNKMTQEDAAKALDIHTSQYSRWENNIGVIAINKVDDVAKLFGVSLDEIKY